ncbi:MAG TPA: iron ABC transporter substrate-binding protein, partial [Acidaminococcaceae bacterium]|nr:iron ABC transporter substrate-binding protein [Acidaminococcaceae bacterium]
MTPASKIKIAPKFNEKWVSENKEKFTKEFTKHLEKSM